MHRDTHTHWTDCCTWTTAAPRHAHSIMTDCDRSSVDTSCLIQDGYQLNIRTKSAAEAEAGAHNRPAICS